MAGPGYQGYYGGTYDRYVSSTSEPSTISKMKETYWTTKQAVITKLGKKQDEHIVASDAELDAKLELFRSIEQSCLDLLRVIEKYQDRLCALSREENAMGRLLKVGSETDKTRAGKMMAAVSKAQNFSSQQLLQLRTPLVRLYQEVEVFRHRAVVDTLITVERMEAARTEYRGALLWMKDVSEVLDPDTSKQLQKFRTVQAQVKRTKVKFDRLKLDTMQKVDLLAASRSNMFSQVLAKYQTAMLTFWEKMSYRMTAVADCFKGYQYYEFNMLKELGEPSKKLAEETGATDEMDILNDSCDENHKLTGVLPNILPIPKASGTLMPLVSLNSDENTSRNHSSSLSSSRLEPSSKEASNQKSKTDSQLNARGSLNNLYDTADKDKGVSKTETPMSFIEFGDDDEEVDIEEVRRRQDEEFDFQAVLRKATEKNKTDNKASRGPMDLLSSDLNAFDLDMDKDDLSLLNDILNTPAATPGSEFSREWQAAFGPMASGGTLSPQLTSQVLTADSDSKTPDLFMPSCLLDMTGAGTTSQLASQKPTNIPLIPPPKASAAVRPPGGASGPKPKKKDQKAEMSAWFSLFAELDPLSNPDAIGRTKDDLTDA